MKLVKLGVKIGVVWFVAETVKDWGKAVNAVLLRRIVKKLEKTKADLEEKIEAAQEYEE